MLTQLEADSNVNVTYQDGLAAGSLINFSVAANGDVVGVNSNGMRQILGRVATATFLNPTGLLKAGDNMYEASTNSGDPAIGTPGTGQRGAISAGFLEMSNVELSQQFTDMIRAQRGFQANSRVISASDQMLQDLVGLIR
jgi:flagellar hook protein FlgE